MQDGSTRSKPLADVVSAHRARNDAHAEAESHSRIRVTVQAPRLVYWCPVCKTLHAEKPCRCRSTP